MVFRAGTMRGLMLSIVKKKKISEQLIMYPFAVFRSEIKAFNNLALHQTGMLSVSMNHSQSFLGKNQCHNIDVRELPIST